MAARCVAPRFAASSSQLALALMLGVSATAAHAQAHGEAGSPLNPSAGAPTAVQAPAVLATQMSEPVSAVDRALERLNPEAMIGQLVHSIDMGAVATLLERSIAQAANGQAQVPGQSADPSKPSPEAQAQAEALQKQMAAQAQAVQRSLLLALTGLIRPMLMGLQQDLRESFRQR